MWVSLFSVDLFCTQLLNWVMRGEIKENAAFYRLSQSIRQGAKVSQGMNHSTDAGWTH